MAPLWFITVSTIFGIAANAACTNPTQFANNPVLTPNTAVYPTIGAPFDITWDSTNMGPTVTLVLLSGCPSNCIVAETIVAGASNTGYYSWTPECTLTADEVAEGYGIQMIDDTLCEFQYSFHFGLYPDTAGVCSPASSSASPALSSSRPYHESSRPAPTHSESYGSGPPKGHSTQSAGYPERYGSSPPKGHSTQSAGYPESYGSGPPKGHYTHSKIPGVPVASVGHPGKSHAEYVSTTCTDIPSEQTGYPSYSPEGSYPEGSYPEGSIPSASVPTVAVVTSVVVVYPVQPSTVNQTPGQPGEYAPPSGEYAPPSGEYAPPSAGPSGKPAPPSGSSWPSGESSPPSGSWPSGPASPPPAGSGKTPYGSGAGNSATWVTNSTGYASPSGQGSSGSASPSGKYQPTMEQSNGAMAWGVSGNMWKAVVGVTSFVYLFV